MLLVHAKERAACRRGSKVVSIVTGVLQSDRRVSKVHAELRNIDNDDVSPNQCNSRVNLILQDVLGVGLFV